MRNIESKMEKLSVKCKGERRTPTSLILLILLITNITPNSLLLIHTLPQTPCTSAQVMFKANIAGGFVSFPEI